MFSLEELLMYASRAPSPYNSQPWEFYATSDHGEFIVAPDLSKALLITDPEYRQIYVALGSFVESFKLAAVACGYSVSSSLQRSPYFSTPVAKINLSQGEAKDIETLELIKNRSTVRNGYAPDKLTAHDELMLSAGFGSFRYFPRGSEEALTISQMAVKYFSKQMYNKFCYKEMLKWVRLTREDYTTKGDGILLFKKSSFLLDSLTRLFPEKFLYSKYLLRKAVNKVKIQSNSGAGWIIISTSNDTFIDWFDTGVKFYRMALAACGENIAIHPMSQLMESINGRVAVQDMVGGKHPQMAVRVGYVSNISQVETIRQKVEVKTLQYGRV